MSAKKSEDKLYVLPVDEVHIWSASLLDHSKDIDYLKSILSQDEQDRAKSFKFSKDQVNYITARGILRCVLSSYLETAPQSIEFVYGLWGKPGLLGKHPLHFNVSHSGDYALYALTRHYEVGIDLEYIDKDFEIENIASTILSLSEKNLWDAVSPDKKAQVFFHLWACKEAYLKATGKGWLEEKVEGCFESTLLFKKILEWTFPANCLITYPYCFEPVPVYVGALFVKGPPLYAVHHQVASALYPLRSNHSF
ncbi:MAG: 4'-phosphopantetheinyl transferase superfamily protein [Alphaproteobacteria bacterium]|nr:4'-phosphopantetheinyl transferase superfamily protein [Alphaproteobacteria bacterium]